MKAMEDAEDLNVQASKNSPAYGVRNVRIVAAGTGEALPGPATCGNIVAGGWCPITDDLGKWVACREGVGGGRSVRRAA